MATGVLAGSPVGCRRLIFLRFVVLPFYVPHGQTSDNWADVKKLVFEPHFVQYMKPAFSPVGLMINFWESKPKAGTGQIIPIILINDTYEQWKGNVQLSLLKDSKIVTTKTIPVSIEQLGKETYSTHYSGQPKKANSNWLLKLCTKVNR